jgi:hypothetical protein
MLNEQFYVSEYEICREEVVIAGVGLGVYGLISEKENVKMKLHLSEKL